MNSFTPQSNKNPLMPWFGRLQDWLVDPKRSVTRQDDRRQARFLSTIQLTLLCFSFVGIFVSKTESAALSQFIIWITVLDFVTYLIGRTYYYRVSAALTIGIIMTQLFIANIFYSSPSLFSLVELAMWSSISVLLCSMVFSMTILIFQASINLIIIWLIARFYAHLDALSLFVPIMFIITISTLIIVAARHRDQLERDRLFELSITNRELEAIRASLEERVAERTKELQLAYDTIQVKHEQLLHSEKMASLGRLTAGVAHEINTPLAAARASVSELNHLVQEFQDSVGDPQVTPDDYKEIGHELYWSLQLVDTAIEHIAGFVRSIKAQTRDIMPRERELFNAVPVIRESLLLVNHALRAGNCAVTFETPVENIELYGLPGQLSQVVTNLVTNAIDASLSKGGGPIMLRLVPSADGADLLVSDEGSGISPEILPRVFDLLFTTKSSGQGTGLGLNIVRDIMTGIFVGTIDVTSQSGQGTTFSLHFPAPGVTK